MIEATAGLTNSTTSVMAGSVVALGAVVELGEAVDAFPELQLATSSPRIKNTTANHTLALGMGVTLTLMVSLRQSFVYYHRFSMQ
jgi:hypothetical protein